MNPTPAFQVIDEHQQQYVSFLQQICSFEARAYDKEEIDRMVDFIEDFSHS